MVRSHRRGRATAGDSADYLVARRGDLAQFEDMAHLASSTDLHYTMPGTTDAQVAAARRLGHHLVVVRAALAEELWTRQIFVDTEVLDELLYWSVRDPDINDPIYGVIQWIRDVKANRPGLLLFPLHSLAVLGAGLIRPARGRIRFINPERGYAVTPQTNDFNRTRAFLDEVAVAFGAARASTTN